MDAIVTAGLGHPWLDQTVLVDGSIVDVGPRVGADSRAVALQHRPDICGSILVLDGRHKPSGISLFCENFFVRILVLGLLTVFTM